MNVLDSFDTNANFWDVNPQLKIAFRKFRDEDSSKDKRESSDAMWAIALLEHPSSKYANTTREYRIKLIENDFLKLNEETGDKPGRPYVFPWKKHKSVIETFKEITITKPEKFLKIWEDKLEERMLFLEKVKYDFDTAEFVDDTMSKTDRIWKQYMACAKMVQEEKEKGDVRGGAQESLSDDNKI